MAKSFDEIILESKKYLEERLSIEPRFVKDNDTAVLLNVPLGKPNRKRVDTKDPLWVTQRRQKGPDLCLYYSLKLSAMMEEGYLEEQNKVQKKIASEYRKERSIISYKNIFIQFLLSQHLKSLKKLNKVDIILILRKIASSYEGEALSPKIAELIKDFDSSAAMHAFLDDFEKSESQNIFDFANDLHMKERIGSGLTFLRRIGLDPMEAYKAWHAVKSNMLKEVGKVASIDVDNFENLPRLHKLIAIESTTDQQLIKIFDLQPLNWSPSSHGIDDLAKLIKAGGKPLLAGGNFGKSTYKNCEFHCNFKHYTVFRVKNEKEDVEPERNSIGKTDHAVLIVGIEKTKGKDAKSAGWVYLIDSEDNCDPLQKDASRTLYFMSYEQFCKRLNNCTKIPVDKNLKVEGLGYVYGRKGGML